MPGRIVGNHLSPRASYEPRRIFVRQETAGLRGAIMMNTCKVWPPGQLQLIRRLSVLLLALAFVSPAYAWVDNIKPTAPGNFRVTQVTPFSVSLAWSPAKDNSGKFSCRLWSSAGLNGGGIEK